MAESVFDLFARLLLDTKPFEEGLDGAKGKATGAGSGIGNAIKGGLKAAATALAAGGTAVAAFGKSAVDAGMQFDYSMSQVQAISGANSEEFDKLREKAREMGRTTKFTAQEAADAFLYMGMAGWEADDMISGIPGILNLASAAGEDLGTTSDIVTDALTAFHLEAKDAGHFADVLAQASARSNTNVGLMGETFKYVAPLAGQMNYSIEDVATAIGLMANSGVKGSMAGTSLRSILTRLADPPKDAAEAMDKLGVSLQDEEGNMYSLRDVMVQLRDGFANNLKMPAEEVKTKLAELDEQFASGKLTEDEYAEASAALAKEAFGAEEALAAEAASAIAGKYGMSGLLAIVGASEADFQKLTSAIDASSETIVKTADGSVMTLNEALASGAEVIQTFNGMAEAMATIMEDNLQGDITKLKSAFSDLKIEVSDALAPALRGFVQEATEKIVAFTEFIHNGGLGDALDGIKDAFNRIKEAISPLTEKIAELASNEDTATGASNALKGAFDLFIEALHIGAEALAFVLEKGAQFIEWLNSGSIGAEALKTVTVALIGGFAAFKIITTVIGWVKAVTTAFTLLHAVLLANPIGLVIAAIAALAAAFVYLWNNNEEFREFWINLWDKVSSWAKEKIEEIKFAFEVLKDAFGAVHDWLVEKIEGIKDGWNGLIARLKEIGGEIRTVCENIKTAFSEATDKVTQFIGTDIPNAFNSALEFFQQLPARALEWGRDLIASFIDGIRNGWNDLKGALGEFAQKVADFLGFSEPKEGPLSNFHTYAPDMMELFAKGIKDNEGLVTAQISRSFNFEPQLRGASPALAAGPTTNTWNITVNGIDELDEIIRWYQGRQVEERMR